MIGIFDSGVGGLTVLRALRENLPSADVLYFGDTKNAPYGTRSREELALLTMNGLKLLHERGVQNIVSACNSVSASLAVSLFETLSIVPTQLIEMVGPTVGFFRGSDARLVLCATPATIQSGIYQNGFRMIGKDVTCVPIEKLAGVIESGAPDAEVEEILRRAFSEIVFTKGDVLILACTHYPLVKNIFRSVLGEDILMFDPAYPVAERAQKLFWPQEVGDGTTRFLISRESETFRTLAGTLFADSKYTIEVLE
jgi:glutamate racemase